MFSRLRAAVPAVLLATAHIDTALGACDLAACQPADIVAAYTSSFGADNCGGATDQSAHQYSTGCDTTGCTKDQLESKFGACGDVYGCTDPLAFNHNPIATVDDGTCVTQAATTYQSQRARRYCETGTSEWETITDADTCVNATLATGWSVSQEGVILKNNVGPRGCYSVESESGIGSMVKPSLNTGSSEDQWHDCDRTEFVGKYFYYHCLCAYTGAACQNTDRTVPNTLYTYDSSGIATEATCGCGKNAVCAHGKYCLVDANGGGTCHTTERIYGCKDSTKYNFNPVANTENDSCSDYSDNTCPATGPNTLYTYNIEGVGTASDCACGTNTCAPNQYCWKPLFAEAQCSDEAPTVGCTNPQAANYNSDADHDDGSCDDVLGCTNPIHDNYDQYANTDDGLCKSFGCTTPDNNGRRPVNYRPIATHDDGSCINPWEGMRSLVATITSGTCTSNSMSFLDIESCYSEVCATVNYNCYTDSFRDDYSGETVYFVNYDYSPDHGDTFPHGCYKYPLDEGGTDYYYWYNYDSADTNNQCSPEKECYCKHELPKCRYENGESANTLRSYDENDTATDLECACADTVCQYGEFCTVTDYVGTCSSA